MKYIVVLGDGMADHPVAALGGKTPLEAAKTPQMDFLAGCGEMGLCATVPKGMPPGSDVANLAILGYTPENCYTGRAGLEALGLGIPVKTGEIACRCNLVTLSETEPFSEKHLVDYSAGEISTELAESLVNFLAERLNTDSFRLYPGVGYRQILLCPGEIESRAAQLQPPHEHFGEKIEKLLPQNPELRRLTEESYRLLNRHPVNLALAAAGKNKANALWPWGGGTIPKLETFAAKYGLRGAMISASALMKGIAVAAEMAVYSVAGATGTLDTNYEGKADAALQALLKDGYDFVYLHLDAPDEMGHQGRSLDKVKAIEALDNRLIARLRAGLNRAGEHYRMLVLPDHPTPVEMRIHTGKSVPFVLYDSRYEQKKREFFTEGAAADTGIFLPRGEMLMQLLLEKEGNAEFA